MCHQNKKIIDTITSYFPVQAIISNLRCPTLAIEAKAGLTRILISLFMNSEKLMHLKKPNTQRVWEKNQVNTWRCPTYMKEEELEEIKGIINTYFKENNSAEDFSLHYEYLRLLSYLLNSDLILGKVSKKREWQQKLASAYELLTNAYLFSVDQLRMTSDIANAAINRRRTTTPNIAQIHDETEEIPLMKVAKELIKAEQIESARTFFI